MKTIIILIIGAIGFASCATNGLIGSGSTVEPEKPFIKPRYIAMQQLQKKDVSTVGKYRRNEPNANGSINNGKAKKAKKSK